MISVPRSVISRFLKDTTLIEDVDLAYEISLVNNAK